MLWILAQRHGTSLTFHHSTLQHKGFFIHHMNQTVLLGKEKGGSICFMVDFMVLSHSGLAQCLFPAPIQQWRTIPSTSLTSIVMTAVYIMPNEDIWLSLEELDAKVTYTRRRTPTPSSAKLGSSNFQIMSPAAQRIKNSWPLSLDQ